MSEIVECYTETHQNTNVISNAKTDMIISHRRHIGTELSPTEYPQNTTFY